MFFKALGLITGHTQARNRLQEWKEEEYNYWLRWQTNVPGSCGPPPLSDSWWNHAIRPSDRDSGFLDRSHYLDCKCDYMKAHR